MCRCHAISPGCSGHCQDLGISSLTGHDSACNLILSVESGWAFDGPPRSCTKPRSSSACPLLGGAPRGVLLSLAAVWPSVAASLSPWEPARMPSLHLRPGCHTQQTRHLQRNTCLNRDIPNVSFVLGMLVDVLCACFENWCRSSPGAYHVHNRCRYFVHAHERVDPSRILQHETGIDCTASSS